MTQDTAVPETDAEASTNMDTAKAAEQIQLWMGRRRDEETEGRGRRRRSGDKSVRLTAVMPAHYLRAGSENLVQEHDVAMSDALLRRVEQDPPREIAGQGSGKETTGGRVAEQRKSCLELREM